MEEYEERSDLETQWFLAIDSIYHEAEREITEESKK